MLKDNVRGEDVQAPCSRSDDVMTAVESHLACGPHRSVVAEVHRMLSVI